jgi:hypothetical protein
MKVKRFFVLTLIAALAASTLLLVAVAAASTVIVTPPVNSQGWSTNDTNMGGTVDFVVDTTAPAGVGALQLTTDASTTAKAQYFHATNTPLANVTELSYYTRQVSSPFVGGDPAYQLVTLLNGTSGFTTLVFEPYQNPLQGPVMPDMWQPWDVDSGLFWSTRSVTCSNGTIVGTAGGPATYTLNDIKTICPNAVVGGFGVNIGSNNPLYDVYTDLVDFNGTTYDFEPYLVANDKDQCKNNGYKNVKRADGSSFKNQGDCIQYVNTGK